jgi:hypothetical protein
MRLIIFPVLLICLSVLRSSGQVLTKEERASFMNIIYDYFHASPTAQNNTNRTYGQSEQMILFFEINDSGNVEQVKLLADNNNLDSGYAILSGLKPIDFKNWRSLTVRNKTIMVPVVVFNSEKDYEKILRFIVGFKKLGQAPRLINLPGMVLDWPSEEVIIKKRFGN